MDAPIPNAYSEELAPTRNKKSKHEHLEGMSGMFRGGMDNLAGAINRLSPLQPISENEIWNMLEELDLESGVNTKAYTFLCRNASACHILIGCPKKQCKNLLTEMMDFKIEPELEYCACIVDLLCRDGRVKDAYNLYKTNFSKPMANALGIVLDACKTNALVELRDVAKEISELDHGDAGRYVQLTHSFASMAQWEGVGIENSLSMHSGMVPPHGLAVAGLRSKRKVLTPPVVKASAAEEPAGPPPITAA
ncbi:hypothetical protein BC332_02398 [Capsicum chinense]|nr:hypothetical protein BC332_02398 [Capsicum chinense]